jgi:hypothetical protein
MEWDESESPQEQKAANADAMPFDRIGSVHADHSGPKLSLRIPKSASKQTTKGPLNSSTAVPEDPNQENASITFNDAFNFQMGSSLEPKQQQLHTASFFESPGGKPPRGSTPLKPTSARGTRKEELEYLSTILGSRTHRGIRVVRLSPQNEDDEEPVAKEGSQTARARTAAAHSKPSDITQEPIGPPKPVCLGKKLPFTTFKTLYDVATFSEFASSQDFAGGGVAALCSLPGDRDSLFGSGAVKYMLDLLVQGKSLRSKYDACDALVALVKSK